MPTNRRVALVGFLCVLLGIAGTADAGPGQTPRNVAVSPQGDTLLITSRGSNHVTVKASTVPFGTAPDAHIDVGAPSWGVTFVNNDVAVITHPERGFLTVLERTGGPFTPRQIPAPHYCTEIIKNPGTQRVLVANRGIAPPGAGSWQHAVYEIDIADGTITKTFKTEREPRALAVSPDGTRLFVGHVQGALGLGGLPANEITFPGNPATIFDGGSILVLNMTTGNPVYRFPIGSPIRGLKILIPIHIPAGGGGIPEPDLDYRVYFTHVGDGAQSEAPTLGGRSIPNVISSIGFDDRNRVQLTDRQDVVFAHVPGSLSGPDFTYDPANHTAQPAILHEKIAIRWDATAGEGEIWVTNSGSGTVSRAMLDQDGRIVTTATPLNIIEANASLPVVTSRDDAPAIPAISFQMIDSTDNNQTATMLFEKVVGPYHVVVDPVPAPTPAWSSHPRGMVYDGIHDLVYVVTEFDHELIQIDPANTATPVSGRISLCTSCSSVAEDTRNFFTFGEGFDFREQGVNPADPVNTLTCATCHVDGHLDGKVRFTGSVPGGKAVAVPSVFDVGSTEWIFFNGLTTVRDGQDAGGGCNYCVSAGFFFDTTGFTNAVQSPRSPHATSGSLSSAAHLRGRSYFERMNCERCHSGHVESEFLRTDFNSIALPGIPALGPIPGVNSPANNRRLLHDPTQVFITTVTENVLSTRNKTDVGTLARFADPANGTGINTPALANSWDNAPYFHDGRYRTLEDVLQHTWVDPETQYLAAPEWTQPGPPDNAFDRLEAVTMPPVPGPDFVGAVLDEPMERFETHRHIPPTAGDWLTVQDYLVANENPGAIEDLELFLRSVSSQTDLCTTSDPTITNFSVSVDPSGSPTTLSWDTSVFPVASRVRWAATGTSLPEQPVWTPVDTSHQIVIALEPGSYDALVEVSSPLCGTPPEAHDDHTDSWSVPCVGPGLTVDLLNVTRTTDGNDFPILHFLDPNPPHQVTGYNIYRAADPSLPEAAWPQIAMYVTDADPVAPAVQWIDASGDIPPNGIWYYQITAYNSVCPAEGPM